MSTSGALLPWTNRQFTYDDGLPVQGGSIQFYEYGTTTPKTTYTDAALTTASPLDSNGRVALNSAGRVTVFLGQGGYTALLFGTVSGSPNTLMSTVAGLINVTQTTFDSFGTGFLYPGGKNVTNGYTILPADSFVTVNSAAGVTNVNLCAAALHPGVLILKNVGANNVTITPVMGETIDGTAGINTNALEVPSTGRQATVWLINDGTSAWKLIAGWF